MRNCRLRPECPIASEVGFSIFVLRLIARECALGLIESGLIGARVDLGEEIASADHLTFLEIYPAKNATSLRFDDDRGQRRDGPQRVECYMDVGRTGTCDSHRHGLQGRIPVETCMRLRAGPKQPREQNRQEHAGTDQRLSPEQSAGRRCVRRLDRVANGKPVVLIGCVHVVA